MRYLGNIFVDRCVPIKPTKIKYTKYYVSTSYLDEKKTNFALPIATHHKTAQISITAKN